MKTVQAIIQFTDLKESVIRNFGDTFNCDDERAKELIEWEFVKEVKEAPLKLSKGKKKGR